MEKWVSFPQLSPSNPLGGHPHSQWRPAQGLGATTITDTMGMIPASAYRVLGEVGTAAAEHAVNAWPTGCPNQL
jgi:hypothetical protein